MDKSLSIVENLLDLIIFYVKIMKCHFKSINGIIEVLMSHIYTLSYIAHL